MFKAIITGLVITLVSAWVVYVSVKGVTIDAIVAGINTRVTVIETATTLQFNTIAEWRKEIKTSLDEIATEQKNTNRKLDKSVVTLDQWKKIK